MGKGGKKTTQTQEQTSSIDPRSRQFIEGFLRPMGKSAARTALGHPGSFFAGPSQAQQDALQRFSQDFSGAGQFGFTPGSFDPSRAQDFFDPFQEQVIGGVQQDFDRQREQAMTRAAQEATQAGAFGGSRSGVLQAEQLRNIGDREAQTLANLRSQGFDRATGRAFDEFGLQQNLGFGAAQARQQGALQGAGLNLQAAGQQFGAGSELQRLAQQRAMEPLFRQRQALQLAQQGFGGPTGGTTNQRQVTKEPGSGLFGNILGIGQVLAGAGALGPIGGAIGGLFGGGGGSQETAFPGGLQQQGQQFFGGAPNFGGSGNLGFLNQPLFSPQR